MSAEDTIYCIHSEQLAVPEEVNESTFWTRYFFRVHQVEREEERRKALLQRTFSAQSIYIHVSHM